MAFRAKFVKVGLNILFLKTLGVVIVLYIWMFHFVCVCARAFLYIYNVNLMILGVFLIFPYTFFFFSNIIAWHFIPLEVVLNIAFFYELNRIKFIKAKQKLLKLVAKIQDGLMENCSCLMAR
jgi:hypothetical protein